LSPGAIKLVHVGCVLLSYALFVLRGAWMLRGSAILQQRWVRVVPHVVDSLLLASAITLAVLLEISPFAAPWLMSKIVALLLYIALGTLAIRRGKTRAIRLTAWLAAQAVFGYIVAVALTHDPLPWRTL
jgi:uncharacterized membrane protein SirB2